MKDYENRSDEELLDRFHNGEQEVMEFILNKYKSLVRKRAKDMYLLGGEVDDLIQEGMIGLFKAVRGYRTDREASFFSFADLCISRQIYTAIQSSRRMKHMPLNTYISLYSDVSHNQTQDRPLIEQLHGLYAESPETLLIDQENVSILRQHMLEKLSKFEQEVLLLYLAGNDYSQIAGLVGRPLKSVDNALQRVRGKLAFYMKKR